jgi:thioredoxin 1
MTQIHNATDDSFDTEVLQADGLVLIDFSATWCGPCKRLDPIVQEIASDYDGQLKVVKVDVDQARSAAAKFGVMSVPTVILMQAGAVKEQLIGLVSKQALAERIDKHL